MALNDNMARFYRRELGLLDNSMTGTFTGTGQSSSLSVAGCAYLRPDRPEARVWSLLDRLAIW